MLTGIRLGILTACCLWAAAVCAEDLTPNPSFEKIVGEGGAWPAGWITDPRSPSIAVITNSARTGEHCVRVTAKARKGAHQSIVITLPAQEGKKYSFDLYVRNDDTDRLMDGAGGVLTIEFFDVNDIETGRASSEPWDSNLSRLRWTHAEVKKVKAPKDTVKAKFVIHGVELELPGHGSFLIDDVTITED